MRNRRNQSKLLALIALVALGCVWTSTRSAQAAEDFYFTSGMAGLAQGQTARLSVVNTLDKAMQVELSFVDGDGKVQLLCDQVVEPGKAVFADFPHQGEINRIELRAVVVVRGAFNRTEARALISTVQFLCNETGKTEVILPRLHNFTPLQS